MAQDINKHLERARKSLEKNKLREAVSEYQAVLEEAPAHQEALQALADIYTRLNEPASPRNITACSSTGWSKPATAPKLPRYLSASFARFRSPPTA